MAKFQPGQSGNPAGRPKGIKDKRVSLREEQLLPLLPKTMEGIKKAVEKEEKWALLFVATYLYPKPKPVDSDEMDALYERMDLLEQIARGEQ